MSHDDDGQEQLPLEIESTERLISGKSEEELLVDLKMYLARLRDNPRSIPDRLRVAAIQLRLGRTQEALIHYEGVLRGYLEEGRVMSAIALCKRVLGHYPDLPRLQRLLAALYARAPHGATNAPSPVTPITALDDQPTTTFVVDDPKLSEEEDSEQLVVARVFPDVHARREIRHQLEDHPTVPYRAQSREEGPTVPYPTQSRQALEDAPTTTMVREEEEDAPTEEEAADAQPPDTTEETVYLLTKPKKKR